MKKDYLTHFKHKSITRHIVFFLIFFLLAGEAGVLLSGQSRGDTLEPLFKRAVMDYRDGRYREVVHSLNELLSFLDSSRGNQDTLKGKIYLLLGATYEQTGRTGKAVEYYRQSAKLMKSPHIEGLDFSFLKYHQDIIKGKEIAPVVAQQGSVIEKTAPAPRKKKRSALLPILGGVVLVGGILALLLLKKNNGDNDEEIDPNYDTNQLGIVWVSIPTGTFQMGDNFNQGEADERPVHHVELQSFHISKHEITIGQYMAYIRDTDSPEPDIPYQLSNNRRPMLNITWGQANNFCQWLSRKTGKQIKLPTEAQWEYAARGTDQRLYPWGNSEPDCSKANYGCGGLTNLISSQPHGNSPFGIEDMAGNVAEWCRDYYDPDYYAGSPEHEPYNSTPTNNYYSHHRVIRGGSFDSGYPLGIRTSDRYHAVDNTYSHNDPENGYRTTRVGFRIAWE